MRRRSPLAKLAGLVGAGLVAAAVAAAPASALPDGYAYEMVTPPDKNDGDVGIGAFGPGQYRASADGNSLLYMALGGFADAPTNSLTGAYVAHRGDPFWTSYSGMLPQLPYWGLGGAILSGVSEDFTRVLTLANRDPETGAEAPGPAGDQYFLDPITRETEKLPLDPIDGVYSANNPLQGNFYGNADFSEAIFTTRQNLVEEALSAGSNPKVYRYADGEITLESRLPGEQFQPGQVAGSSNSHQGNNPVSADAKVFYFMVSSRLYRRDLSGPTPETVFVNAEENPDEEISPGTATFAGASADGTVAYFVSNQRLVAEDTDSTNDVYRYDHSQPEGSRLTLVSVDNEPGDAASATGNTLGVTADGDTVYFLSNSQLVAGETTEPGAKLFAWHDGELRFIAITGSMTATATTQSENGEYFGFTSAQAGITPEDNGGFAQAYVYSRATEELVCVSCVGGDDANTQPATWRQQPGLSWFLDDRKPLRNISNDGRAFFETAEPLAVTDTNGRIDVYTWADGQVDLISGGRSSDDSFFMDASADGETVFFVTRERLSGWDVDDHVDAYAARLGGGQPEPTEPDVPCSGDECQGPPALPPLFPPLRSEGEHPGNPGAEPVDCTPAERKVSRLQGKVKQLNKKAKRLKKQARKASGKKAKRLNRQAKKVKRQVKAQRKQLRQARNQLGVCRDEAEL